MVVIATQLRLAYYSVMSRIDAHALLREAGLRATPGRMALIELMAREPFPRTVEDLAHKLKDALNTVTLYRALEALTNAGIVERSDLRHGHAHYELVAGRPHHHHLICRSCDAIEDIEVPHAPKLEREAVKRSRQFSEVVGYSLEFYGTCRRCS